MNTPSRHKIGTVGHPIEKAAIELAPDGEIVACREYPLCLGYLAADGRSMTSAAFINGRMPTGDIGRLDEDGFLILEGRKNEVIVTSGGYKVHPESLETMLTLDGIARHVVVLGG